MLPECIGPAQLGLALWPAPLSLVLHVTVIHVCLKLIPRVAISVQQPLARKASSIVGQESAHMQGNMPWALHCAAEG